jgi:hypothetical protein
MAFLGLGSFGTGLVTGLAEGANKALQEDMDRINRRIDTISEYRVKKAISEAEERKKEFNETTEALQEAEKLFQGHPRASEMAAALLNDSGSLSAFQNEVATLRQEQRTNPRNLANYFELQESTNPAGTAKDYARAFMGAPTTDIDYKIPEGMTGSDKSLLGTLGFNVDISGRVQQQTQEVLGAAGIGKEPEITIALPSIQFKRENYNMSRMNATERVEYLNNQLANPDNAPERVTELEGYLTTALNTASQTGDIDTQINAATQLLDRMSPEDEGFNEARDNLINLHDSRDLRQAELEGDIAKEYGVKIRQALRNDNTDEVARLTRELNTKLGKGETPAQEYERLTNEFIQKVNDGTLVEGTPEFIAAQNAINKKRANINTYGTAELEGNEIAIAQNTLQSRTNDIIAKNLNMLPSDIDAVLRSRATKGYEALSDPERELYDQIVGIYNNAETQASSELRSKYADPSSLNYWPEMASVLSGKADGVVLDEESSNAPPEVSTEAVTEQLPGAVAQDITAEERKAAYMLGEYQLTDSDIEASRNIYPDTTQGANSYFQTAVVEGTDSIEDVISDAITFKYSDEFVNQLRQKQKDINSIVSLMESDSFTDEELKMVGPAGKSKLLIDAVSEQFSVDQETASELISVARKSARTRDVQESDAIRMSNVESYVAEREGKSGISAIERSIAIKFSEEKNFNEIVRELKDETNLPVVDLSSTVNRVLLELGQKSNNTGLMSRQ